MKAATSKALLTLAVGLSTCCLLGCVAGLFADPDPAWLPRYRLFGLGFLLASGAICLWIRLRVKLHQQAQHYFEALARLDAPQLARLASGDEPIPLPATNPWFELAQRFTDRFAANCERLAKAEHSRDALEIRVRRAAARLEQIEAVLDGMPEAIVAIDQFDELILANPAAEALFELDAKSAVGQPLDKVLHCQQLIEMLIDTRRRKTHGGRRGEVELRDAAGQSHWLGVACQSMASHDRAAAANRPAGAFALLRDAGDQKAAEKRYADFVSSVSHEMKSPLAGIKAYVELLADGEATDEQTREEFVQVIGSQANRLQRLIDNLLNLAQIEAGAMNVSKDNVSLNDLLAETLDVLRPSAEAKRISLTAELSPMYLAAHADRDMMTQVAINLLSNAIKYTPEGGRVTLRSRLADAEVQFEAEDSGVGLSAEDQVRVFEKFYRVKKDRSMAGGTGLGLPLAKLIVEDVHGGRLTVRSTPGSGSVFIVSLPAAARMT